MLLNIFLCMGISTFCTYFTLRERTVSKLKVLLLAVVYTILLLAIIIMPFLQGLPEVISRFILYSAELFLFVGLLAVNGERNLKKTMFYTLFSYLSWMRWAASC